MRIRCFTLQPYRLIKDHGAKMEAEAAAQIYASHVLGHSRDSECCFSID